jgi:hypothetical protein
MYEYCLVWVLAVVLVSSLTIPPTPRTCLSDSQEYGSSCVQNSDLRTNQNAEWPLLRNLQWNCGIGCQPSLRQNTMNAGQGEYASTCPQNVCHLCTTGKFQSYRPPASTSKPGYSEYAMTCIDCPGGKYAFNAGAAACDMCPQNKFSGRRTNQCRGCPEGKYADTGWEQCEQCEVGTNGFHCQYSDQDTCHGNGMVAANGSCRCHSGWTMSSACSRCAEGYYGPSCYPCPDLNRATSVHNISSVVCSGRGNCDGNGPLGSPCSCTEGWVGYTCQEQCPVAPGGMLGFSCSGHGNCKSTGATSGDAQCICEAGWSGKACATKQKLQVDSSGPQCQPACHNSGVCTTTSGPTENHCICPSTWTGDDCTTQVRGTLQKLGEYGGMIAGGLSLLYYMDQVARKILLGDFVCSQTCHNFWAARSRSAGDQGKTSHKVPTESEADGLMQDIELTAGCHRVPSDADVADTGA